MLKIALVGYGKMGKAIAEEAEKKGHSIVTVIDLENWPQINTLSSKEVDVVIEFTRPESFIPNLQALLPTGIPVVTGTTGWYDEMDKVKALVDSHEGGLLYGSNFSIGVNILFQLNQKLAEFMDKYKEYDCFVEERHHRHKADAPSGTAITLGNQLIENLTRKEKIVTDALQSRRPSAEEVSIGYVRSGEIIGHHKVVFTSEIDAISIEHQAYNRRGFALGAIVAAEWLVGKQGFYNFVELFT